MRKINDYLINIGVDDRNITLFEGQYHVDNGMCYNSYLILDEKTCILDTVDSHFIDQWLDNVKATLKNRQLDYLIVHHMEPDHSSGILSLIKAYPDLQILISSQGLTMLKNFFPELINDIDSHITIIKENDILNLGQHVLRFLAAPFVHWPEVMMSYEEKEKILFSADAFGRFGIYDDDKNYLEDSRRYYIGIVGKYGLQVTNVLNKASKLDISMICPLHGNVLSSNLDQYIKDYLTWSSYSYEDEDVTLVYASVYGHTKEAALLLKEELEKLNKKVYLFDLTKDDMHRAIAHAFAHKNLVIASITYNNDLFPVVKTFLNNLKERNFQKRNISLIENGSWSPLMGKLIKDSLSTLKDLTFLGDLVTIRSSLNLATAEQIKNLAISIAK